MTDRNKSKNSQADGGTGDTPPAPRKRSPRSRKNGGAAKATAETAAIAETATPGIADAATAKPADNESGASRSAPNRPAITDPAVAEPAVAQPVVAQPAVTQSAVAPAASAQPEVARPAADKPSTAKQRGAKGAAATRPQGPAASEHAAAAQPPAAPAPAALAGPALIRVPLSVRWRDLDAFNHVNNSKFLSYLEEARLRWMLALPGHGMDDHVAPVVAAAHLNYRRPIEWPNEIEVELFVERLGNTSLSIGHRIVGANDPGALYCDGSVVLVWIHRETGQPAALPAPVRSACSAS